MTEETKRRGRSPKNNNPANELREIEAKAYQEKINKEDQEPTEVWRETVYDSRGKPKTIEKKRFANGNVYSNYIGPGINT